MIVSKFVGSDVLLAGVPGNFSGSGILSRLVIGLDYTLEFFKARLILTTQQKVRFTLQKKSRNQEKIDQSIAYNTWVW